MPIRVTCAACGTTMKLADAAAGKRGKCPRCQAVIEVPAAPPQTPAAPAPADDDIYDLADSAPRAVHQHVRRRASETAAAPLKAAHEAAAAPRRSTLTPVEILASFRGEIRPVRPSLLYRLWVLIVALFMVMLPLVYLAIVAAVGFGVYYHATHSLGVFHQVRDARPAVLLYVTPLVAGVIVIIFMLKPLFARPVRPEKSQGLDPTAEPLVFAFVDGVCQTVGAPRPARINIDCDVNASAQLPGGPFSRELVLNIGLPLVAGLEINEFAGVLAHEFGHFSQATGIRVSYLIGSINRWFARVVYERDSWDQMLTDWSHEGSVWLLLIVGMARLAVWLTRRILWCLMYVGHMVSCFQTRQLEYDADRYQARMIGGQAVGEMLWKVHELSLAETGAQQDLAQSWSERRLPDNLPRLIQANLPQIPEAVRQALRQDFDTRRTGLFSTHPAPADRIASALRDAPDDGLFHLEGPATALFRDFDKTARDATFRFYRSRLGPEISRDQLYPVAEVLANQAVSSEGEAAHRRFFQYALGALQALPLPEAIPTTGFNLANARDTLNKLRKELVSLRLANCECLKRWDEAAYTIYRAETARVHLVVGNKIKPQDWNLPAARQDAAETAKRNAEAALQQQIEGAAVFGKVAARRLLADLAILHDDAFVARAADLAIHRDEADALYPCAAALNRAALPALPPLIAAASVASSTLNEFAGTKGDKPPQGLVNAALRAGQALHAQLTSFQNKLSDHLPYPFEHAQDGITVRRAIMPPVLPDAQSVPELHNIAVQVIERVTGLNRRLLGRLAVAGEAVETSLGLPPLEAPKHDDE